MTTVVPVGERALVKRIGRVGLYRQRVSLNGEARPLPVWAWVLYVGEALVDWATDENHATWLAKQFDETKGTGTE